jgi:glycosyltransferase involved in cell wall biosynthesis
MEIGLPAANNLLPGITACVACHPARMENGLLNRALASISAQTHQPEAVAIVNDVGRLGAGRTRQRLLNMVRTSWIAWLDSDDEWHPDHLSKLVQVAQETSSVFVFSYFYGFDMLGHFSRPFDPCHPHHTTMTHLVRTDLAKRVGFRDNAVGPFANEDWGFITGVAEIACAEGLRMTHLAERTWTYHQQGQNSSGQPGQGDAR